MTKMATVLWNPHGQIKKQHGICFSILDTGYLQAYSKATKDHFDASGIFSSLEISHKRSNKSKLVMKHLEQLVNDS